MSESRLTWSQWTYQHCVFVCPVDDNIVMKDLHFYLLHPQGQGRVSVLILSCDCKIRDCVQPLALLLGNCCAKHQRAAALEIKSKTIKCQVMAVARDDAGGIRAGLAVVETTLLQAVLVLLTGDVLTAHAVVRPVAVTEVVAVNVHPEGLVGEEVVPLKAAATFTAGNAVGASQCEPFVTLAALLAAVHAHRSCPQSLTGFQTSHALLKVAVLRTCKS